MLSVLVAPIARLKGFKTVNWLQDLYPEVAAELGVGIAKGLSGRMLAAPRNVSLRRAALNVAIGEDMAARLRSLRVPAAKIAVIQNWTDDGIIVPLEPEATPLRQEWGLEGKFVVAYSGNLGRAHDVETMLDAAERLRARQDIVFLFIGSGHGISEVDAAARRRGLQNIVFKPYQPRELLSQSLAVGDVHWLSLKPGLDGLILPSKFYGIAAAARPIVVIGSRSGELSRLVTDANCGVHIEIGKGEELARVLVSLAGDPVRCRQMGLNARRVLEERFTKEHALKRWHEVLSEVADIAADRVGERALVDA